MAANDRAELEELRRLDALEARSGGNVPRETVTPESMALEGMPEWERRAAGVGRSMSEPFEGVGQIIDHLRGRGAEADKNAQEKARAMEALYKASPASRSVKTATDITTGMLTPAMKIAGVPGWLGRVLSGAATGGAYGGLEPVTSGEDFTSEKAKQLLKGGASGGILSGLFEGLSKIPGLVKKSPPLRQPSDSKSADVVTAELSRQNDLKSSDILKGSGGSEYEKAVRDFEGRMTPMREAAFQTGARVDTTQTLDAIQKLRDRNPDAQVRSALKEVEDTIRRATKGSQARNLPAAGARMTPQELRALQGQGATMDVAMADEVRQSINRVIEGKGDKTLAAHTKDLLSQIRDHLVGKTPQEYRDYLAAYAKGAEGLEKYRPERGVTGKLSEGMNPETFLADTFGGKTSIRDYKDLVERTAHDPVASKELKKSFGEWLTKPDPTTRIVSPENLMKRWDSARRAAQESGLMQPDHVKMIDSLMDDLVKLKSKRAMSKDVATVGGFFLGMPIGHPFMASHFARDIAGDASKRRIQENATDIVMSLALGDAKAAKLLAAPPTDANMSALEQFLKAESFKLLQLPPSNTGRFLQKTVSSTGGRKAGEQEAPPSTRNLRQLQGVQP